MNSFARMLGHKTVPTSSLEGFEPGLPTVHDPDGVWHLYISIPEKGFFVLGKATVYVTKLGKAFNQYGRFKRDMGTGVRASLLSGVNLPAYRHGSQRVRGDARHIWIECKEVLEHMALIDPWGWGHFNDSWEPVVTLKGMNGV